MSPINNTKLVLLLSFFMLSLLSGSVANALDINNHLAPKNTEPTDRFPEYPPKLEDWLRDQIWNDKARFRSKEKKAIIVARVAEINVAKAGGLRGGNRPEATASAASGTKKNHFH